MKKSVMLVLAAVLLMGVLFAGAVSAGDSITICNATDTINLEKVDDFIYGDYGSQNGTATLTHVGTDENDPWILELDHFNASSSSPFSSTIDTNQIPLKIIVKNGQSKLTCAGPSVINEMMNLTITSADVNTDELICELHEGSPMPGSGISSGQIFVISHGRVKVTAPKNAIGIDNAYGLIICDGSYVDVTSPQTGLATGFGNITISDNSYVNVKSEYGAGGMEEDAYAIRANAGNVTIRNSNVELYANSTAGNAYGINAKKNIDIDSSSRVTATAESAADNKLAAGLYADTGDITIKNKARVTAKANFTGALFEDLPGAYGMWAKTGNITITGKNTLVDAKADGHPAFAFAIYAGDMLNPVEGVGHLRIKDGSTVQASASIDVLGNIGNFPFAIFATNDIDIDSAKKVTAVAKHMGADEGSSAIGIRTYSGSISIINTEVVAYAWQNSCSPYGIQSSGDIIIDSSKVTVVSMLNVTAVGDIESVGIEAINRIIIKGADTVIDVQAMGRSAVGMKGHFIDIQSGDITVNATQTGKDAFHYTGYGIMAINPMEKDGIITISGCDRIKATGTSASFATEGEQNTRDFDALKTGYVFSNATSPGSDPTSFEQFKNDWQIDENEHFSSNYTSVLIEKKSSPVPYTPSHRESGQTVILQEGQVAPTVTPTPTPTPTVKPIETPAGNSTIKPTTVPTKPSTSKSPAPFVGIIAGLGAALVLTRLRK